jgi:hypothetical protein
MAERVFAVPLNNIYVADRLEAFGLLPSFGDEVIE